MNTNKLKEKDSSEIKKEVDNGALDRNRRRKLSSSSQVDQSKIEQQQLQQQQQHSPSDTDKG
ncbi:hypothetical protein TYRP_003169 [Tyrophagus putrescentiae]|nr:hypothetical protein TYRP_003169 [Tyrophagus putrescentiae]